MPAQMKTTVRKHRPPTDAEIELGRKRGREEYERGAVAVHYRPRPDVIVLEMRSGATVMLPRKLIPFLGDKPKAVAAGATLSPAGTSLWFDAADLHYSVVGLIREVLGLDVQQRRAGAARSPAKAAASRANGAKGGRPRKTAAALERRNLYRLETTPFSGGRPVEATTIAAAQRTGTGFAVCFGHVCGPTVGRILTSTSAPATRPIVVALVAPDACLHAPGVMTPA